MYLKYKKKITWLILIIILFTPIIKFTSCEDEVKVINIRTIPKSEVDKNIVYIIFSLSNNTIILIEHDTGANISKQEILTVTKSSPSTKPAYSPPYLVVAGADNILYVYDISQDKEKLKWSKEITSDIEQIEIIKSYLIVRLKNKLEVYNIEDQAKGAIYSSTFAPMSPVAIYKTYLIVIDDDDWNLRRIEIGTWEEEVMEQKLSGSMLEFGYALHNNISYAVTKASNIHSIDMNTFSENWTIAIPEGDNSSTNPCIGLDQDKEIWIYVGSENGKVYNVSEKTRFITEVMEGSSPVRKLLSVTAGDQGYVILAVYDGGYLKTLAVHSYSEEKSYELSEKVVDADVFKQNFYLALPSRIVVVPVQTNPVRAEKHYVLWSMGPPPIQSPPPKGRISPIWFLVLAVIAIAVIGIFMKFRGRKRMPKKEDFEEFKDLI